MSGASGRANGRGSGPVPTSLFLVDPDHSAILFPPLSCKRVEVGKLGARKVAHNSAPVRTPRVLSPSLETNTQLDKRTYLSVGLSQVFTKDEDRLC